MQSGKNLKSNIDSLLAMNYKEKREIYTQIFSIGNFAAAENINDRLILISLIALVYLKTKQKKEDVTPLQILQQITGQKEDNSEFYKMLETLSILVEDFTYMSKTADACGLKTSKEIINKIKEILNTWMPF